MLGDNIVTVLINFVTYFMFHQDFRQNLIQTGINVGEALLADLGSPALPYPPLYNLALPDQIAKMGYQFE